MLPTPSQTTIETIRGNPDHKDAAQADAEYDALISSDFGQPYLVAVKRVGEEDVLHLRVLVDTPGPSADWADVKLAPPIVQELVAKTSPRSAVASELLVDEQTLVFDDSRKINPWLPTAPTAGDPTEKNDEPATNGDLSDTVEPTSDAAAEEAEYSDEEVSALERQTEEGDYEVPDATANVKTRGSAQRVFAKKVKENYGWRCALTGIATRSYLIASHIVPWGHDQSIRLDPANGICLSVFVDRAFEQGHLLIEDDLTVRVNWDHVDQDKVLADKLRPFDGSSLAQPKASPPNPDYLQRRREMSP
nr:HNH endonuclease signature motif containing protein [Qipengyuania pelagi]